MFRLLICIHFFVLFCGILAQYDPNNYIIGNLKRRESIPLYKLARRFAHNDDDDLNYRRTREIREYANALKDRRIELPNYRRVLSREVPDKTFQMTEQLLRDAKLADQDAMMEKLNREMRWLTIDTDDAGFNIGVQGME